MGCIEVNEQTVRRHDHPLQVGDTIEVHSRAQGSRPHRPTSSGLDPIYIDDVAVDFPKLKLLQAHSGRPFWYEKAFSLSRLHENVYMEISGLPPQKLLTYFPELERIAHKIIYGSDWPGVPTFKENIEALQGLNINTEAKRMILGENAARLLKL